MNEYIGDEFLEIGVYYTPYLPLSIHDVNIKRIRYSCNVGCAGNECIRYRICKKKMIK